MTDESSKKASIGGIAVGWWKEINPVMQNDGRRRGDSGAFARLRRADLPAAMIEERTYELFNKLRDLDVKISTENLFQRAALIAAVLAHVREHDPSRRVAQAAGEKIGEQRLFHPLRLRRLFTTHSMPDCLVAFRRVVAVLDRKANITDLALTLFEWPDEIRGDMRRAKWAFDYYGASKAVPEADDEQAV